MPFAEPRPNRRPFCAHDFSSVVVTPKAGNLALTSLTISNQDDRAHFVDVLSTKGANVKRLLQILVPDTTTVHLPFPHPIMVGTGRSLSVSDLAGGPALFPITVVGYEWVATDDKASIAAK
jgi:hypothetical protein